MTNYERVIFEAKRVCGMCACSPFRAAFRKFLGPLQGGQWQLDKPFRQWQDPPGTHHTEGMSSCAIATERIWLGAGMLIPDDWYPHDYLHNPTFVRTHVWPSKLGALGDLRLMPLEGCAFWTAAHFGACVVRWFDPWSTELEYQDCTTVEGGGVCLRTDGGHEGRGLQTVHEHHRRYWPDLGHGAWIADVSTKGAVGPKSRVEGWIDVGRLPFID